MLAGVELVHVPYRGNGPALADLLGGQVAVTFASSASALGYVRSGKLRALALTGVTRLETLPDIPTMGSSSMATR
jgi:tripartite-type tricarboxylate transporter receptor subunit TctC